MGLHGAQSFLTLFKAVNHDRPLEGRNDQSRDPLCVDPWADFPRFDSGTDHRNKVAAPAPQGLASALAQNGISVVCIYRRVEQRTAAGNNSPALNEIRNQLL